ncbi:MAG: hypothetical protein ACKOC5_16495 [Chloroflexota bacterium]
MNFIREQHLTARLARVIPRLAVIYLLPAIMLAAAVYSALRSGAPVSDYVRDLASVASLPPLTGFFSTAGSLLWGAAAAICYLGWAVLRHSPGDEDTAWMLFWAAVMGTLLCIDDMFLLHEEVMWKSVGFGEKQFYLLYLLSGALGAWRYRRQLLRSEYLYLAAAVGLLGLSVGIDALRDAHTPWDHLLEETPKWFGIVTWLAYWAGVCANTLRARILGANPGPAAGK